MYLLCGPRQLFFFQCGPETPKSWTPLSAEELIRQKWKDAVFLYILTMSQHIYIFWLSNSKLLYRKSDYDNHYLIWSIQYKAIYETTEYMIGWWNKWEGSKNIYIRLLRLRDLGSQHADWKPIINKVSGSDMCYMCIVLKCSSGHPRPE